MNAETLIPKLHPLERKIIPVLKEKFSSRMMHKTGLSDAEVLRALQWLSSKDVLTFEKIVHQEVTLDEQGEEYLEKGLPEIRLLKTVSSDEKSFETVCKKADVDADEINIAIGMLRRNNLISIRKDASGMMLCRTPEGDAHLENYKNPLEMFRHARSLEELSDEEKKLYEELSRRKKIVKLVVVKDFAVELKPLGHELIELVEGGVSIDFIEHVDENVIKSETWKEKGFRGYDINVMVPRPDAGRIHPMTESNNMLRDIFIEMGFVEMEGPMVEVAFWNMDILWIPQDHPARDEQDTFYLDGEGDIPADIVEGVRKMHEEGIKRAHTLKGEWSVDIAKRRLLRTHSTATTFRVLAELGKRHQNGENINGKYFYVANNFRNEAVDATHLADFYQAEGFIIGDDLGLADLMGFVKEYYAKFGIDKIRFKPTFNPYTEPSMEAHYYDKLMDKWYALINSGIFRPETLLPIGIDKTIIAWGMGANRVATLLAKKSSMREIVGPECDLEYLRRRPNMKRSIVRGD